MSNNLENIDYFEPLEVTQGEAFVWKKSLDDFPPDEWDAQYRFRGILGVGTGFNVDGTADGSDFLFEATAAQTAAASVTTYEWQLWVTRSDDSNETYQIASGRLNVKKGFTAGSTAAVDTRSTAVQILAAIDAAISGQATSKQLEYEISTPAGSRRLKFIPLADLVEARKIYAGIVSRERTAERMRNGGSLFKNHRIRLRGEGA